MKKGEKYDAGAYAKRSAEMARLRAKGVTFAAIGAKFGVSATTAMYSVRRLSVPAKQLRPVSLSRMGVRYGSLVALFAASPGPDSHRRWTCLCTRCNSLTEVKDGNLHAKTGGCGCGRRRDSGRTSPSASE